MRGIVNMKKMYISYTSTVCTHMQCACMRRMSCMHACMHGCKRHSRARTLANTPLKLQRFLNGFLWIGLLRSLLRACEGSHGVDMHLGIACMHTNVR